MKSFHVSSPLESALIFHFSIKLISSPIVLSPSPLCCRSSPWCHFILWMKLIWFGVSLILLVGLLYLNKLKVSSKRYSVKCNGPNIKTGISAEALCARLHESPHFPAYSKTLVYLSRQNSCAHATAWPFETTELLFFCHLISWMLGLIPLSSCFDCCNTLNTCLTQNISAHMLLSNSKLASPFQCRVDFRNLFSSL